MRIQFRKDMDPERVQRVLRELFRQVANLRFESDDGRVDPFRHLVPTGMNLYLSLRDSQTGEAVDLPCDWEVVPEAYCYTDKTLLFADPEQKLYIYALERKDET